MRPRRILVLALASAAVLVSAVEAAAQPRSNLFFLHHSTGRNLIQEGGVRAVVAAHNAQKQTAFAFWDHDYNFIGLSDPEGTLLRYSYGIPNDNTDPDGLHQLWTTDNPARTAILANHEVIAFKSCYPASDIQSDAMLAQYKQWYLEMRDVFDQHPHKLFVVLSPPPLHRLATDAATADRARAFARWLGSEEFLAGRPNLRCFDFFDHLASPDDGSPTRNMLRFEYERSHTYYDSHPNTLANEAIGPLFAAALLQAGSISATAAPETPPSPARLEPNYPNPFNPLTTIPFTLARPGAAVLSVHDAAGRLVRILAAGVYPAGRHLAIWDGRDDRGAAVGSGLYYCRLASGGATAASKLILVR